MGMTRPRAIALGLCLCSAAMAQPRGRFVDPLATDPAITILDSIPNWQVRRLDHYVVDAAPADRRGLLYVHLPGSGGLPERSTEIAEHAARMGFDVVSIAYPSWPPVTTLARGTGDPQAAGLIRQERLFGDAVSPLVSVSEADSVVNRIAKLLAYNHAQDPAGGWDRYLDAAGQPRWNLIAVGGHSQGAGHAGYLSRLKSLAGVIMFAGPSDVLADGTQASWVSWPAATDPSRIAGFVHVLDSIALASIANWLDLGTQTPVQDIDGLDAGSITSRRLISDITVPGFSDYHGCVVTDPTLFRAADGSIVYAPVWTALLENASAAACNAADFGSAASGSVPDGILSGADFLAFLDAFERGEARADLAGPADPRTPDGVLSGADFFGFLLAFAAGC